MIRLQRTKGLAIGKIVYSTLVVVSSLLTTSCTEKERLPKCFVFSNHFVGWVSVQYDVAHSEVLTSRNGCLWLDFRKASAVRTSSEMQQGWAQDRYLEDVDGSLKPLVVGSTVGRAVQSHVYRFSGLGKKPDFSLEYLFLGTGEEQKVIPEPGSSNLSPLP